LIQILITGPSAAKI